MDVPEFIEHVTEIISDANKSEKKIAGVECEKMQETLVIHYLASVATKMEDVNKEYKKYIYT
jgi:hypothetical protein